ncbi:sugar phosphate isomerase/epimerase family protein [Alteribacillus sp. HJP-4]|uniref:sugar phosphate isomerase/epimerase family protein n=1 Tax=Alteribacillus sp. HJP-4 TaxID=2775394 RepID=UPI0035CD01AE
MKLAFTTLGCPGWNLDQIISNAVKSGFDGVDFRGYMGELNIYNLPEFTSDLEYTKKKFKEASLEIPCFSSSIRLFTTSPEEHEKHVKEFHSYAKLCQEFHTPYIRVFGGKIGKTLRADATCKILDNLKDYVQLAEKYQVTLLLETHDDWTNCEFVNEILERLDSDFLYVLWDIHHPYRTVQEAPERTWELLGEKIKYTHWKDSYIAPENKRGYQLCLLGEGDVPLEKIYTLLRTNNYDGYFTLEWEKLWWPDLAEPEIAFSQYSDFMRTLFSRKL